MSVLTPQENLIVKRWLEEQQQKPAITDLGPEVMQRWNDWASSRIEDALERRTDLLIETSAEVVEERIAEETAILRGEIAVLRSEVEALRSEIAELRDDVLNVKGVATIGARRAAG
jgi:hypothetical protein